jgi:hypothetical protein
LLAEITSIKGARRYLEAIELPDVRIAAHALLEELAAEPTMT